MLRKKIYSVTSWEFDEDSDFFCIFFNTRHQRTFPIKVLKVVYLNGLGSGTMTWGLNYVGFGGIIKKEKIANLLADLHRLGYREKRKNRRIKCIEKLSKKVLRPGIITGLFSVRIRTAHMGEIRPFPRQKCGSVFGGPRRSTGVSLK